MATGFPCLSTGDCDRPCSIIESVGDWEGTKISQGSGDLDGGEEAMEHALEMAMAAVLALIAMLSNELRRK
jgi:hypothetical protein